MNGREDNVYRMGIYEKALLTRPLPEMFGDAARAGFDNFEISLDEADMRLDRLEWSFDQCAAVRRSAAESGVQLFSACLSGHRRFPLGSADPPTEARALEVLRKGIRFCCNMGIRVLQIAGFDVFYEPRTPDTARRYRENLARGARMAEQAGVMLAVEPVEDYITSVHAALELVEEIASPWLQLYPDAANLVAMGFDPAEELRLGAKRLVGLHIRDARPGTSFNLEMGSGTLDFDAVFRTLEEIGFHGPIVLELWNQENPDYMDIVTSSRRFLNDAAWRAR